MDTILTCLVQWWCEKHGSLCCWPPAHLEVHEVLQAEALPAAQLRAAQQLLGAAPVPLPQLRGAQGRHHRRQLPPRAHLPLQLLHHLQARGMALLTG